MKTTRPTGDAVRFPLLALLIAAAGLGACASREPALAPVPRETVLPSSSTRLPVRWWDDAILLDVHLDGRGPYTFVLDTGAGVTVVDRRVAEAPPGLTSPASLQAVDSDGRTVTIDTAVRLPSLRIGEAEFRDLAGVVMDLEFLSRAVRFRVDGILAFPAFGHHLLTLDFPAREVRLEEGSLGAEDGDTILPLTGPFTPRVHLGTGTESPLVIIDTGSREGVALSAWPAGAEFVHGPVPGTRGAALGGPTVRPPMARLAGTFTLGGHALRRPVVSLTRGSPRIGLSVLRHFRVTFDARGRKVRFTRVKTGPLDADPVRGVGARFGLSEEGWEVWDVVPGTPAAAAGLRVGDRVLRIDDLDARAGNDDRIRDLLRRSGREVRLSVLRGGDRIDVALPVVDLVP